MEVVSGDNWSYKSCKAPVKSSPATNQHPVFYRPDAIPVANQKCQSTDRKNITFHGLAYPKLTRGLPTLSLTLIAPGYLGEGCHDCLTPLKVHTSHIFLRHWLKLNKNNLRVEDFCLLGSIGNAKYDTFRNHQEATKSPTRPLKTPFNSAYSKTTVRIFMKIFPEMYLWTKTTQLKLPTPIMCLSVPTQHCAP